MAAEMCMTAQEETNRWSRQGEEGTGGNPHPSSSTGDEMKEQCGGAVSRGTLKSEREKEGGFGSCSGALVLEHLQPEPVVIQFLQAWQAADRAGGESALSQAGATLDFCEEEGIADNAWPICSKMDCGE